jgi:hypothetical protein
MTRYMGWIGDGTRFREWRNGNMKNSLIFSRTACTYRFVQRISPRVRSNRKQPPSCTIAARGGQNGLRRRLKRASAGVIMAGHAHGSNIVFWSRQINRISHQRTR